MTRPHDGRDFYFHNSMAGTPQQKALLPTVTVDTIQCDLLGFRTPPLFESFEFTNLTFGLNRRPPAPTDKTGKATYIKREHTNTSPLSVIVFTTMLRFATRAYSLLSHSLSLKPPQFRQ